MSLNRKVRCDNENRGIFLAVEQPLRGGTKKYEICGILKVQLKFKLKSEEIINM